MEDKLDLSGGQNRFCRAKSIFLWFRGSKSNWMEVFAVQIIDLDGGQIRFEWRAKSTWPEKIDFFVVSRIEIELD